MYNFHDLKRACWNTALPADVNKLVEDRSRKVFDNKKLNAMLVETREKKLYGTGYFIINGFAVADYDFQFGVCVKFNLIGESGISFSEFMENQKNAAMICIFKRSIHNENVDMKNINRKEWIK